MRLKEGYGGGVGIGMGGYFLDRILGGRYSKPMCFGSFKKMGRAILFGVWIMMGVGGGILQAQPEGASDPKATFDFREQKAVVVFNWIQDQYKVVVVAPPVLSGEKITIRSEQAMNLDQAYELLLSALLAKRYYSILDKTNRTIEIVSLGELGKVKDRLRSVANPKPETLVDSQEIIVVKLLVESGSAQMVKSHLLAHLSFPNWVKIEVDPSRDSVEIIGSVVIIKQILGELERAKKSFTQDDTGLRNFYIKYAKARFAFQMLVDFLKLKEKSENDALEVEARRREGLGPAGDFKPPDPKNPPPPPPPPPPREKTAFDLLKKLPSASGVVGAIQFQFYLDEANSVIVALAPPSILALAERFLRQYDVEFMAHDQLPSLPQLKSFYFNHVDVATAIELLSSLFSSIYGETADPTRRTSGPERTTNERRGGNDDPPPPPPPPQMGGTISKDIQGRISFTANKTANNLLVLALSDDLDIVEKAIREFDVPVPQVLIDIQAMEVVLTDDWQFGVAYRLKQQSVTQNQGFEGNLEGKHLEAFTDLAQAAQKFGSDTSMMLLSGAKLDLLLRMLKKETRLTVVSAPKVIARNNQAANIEIKDTVYFIQVEEKVIPAVANPPTPERISTIRTYPKVGPPPGLGLTVTPNINGQKQVVLDIKISLQEISGSPIEPAAPPPLSGRTMNVSASVKNGQTVLIGGIVKNRQETIRLKTPILSEIPLIGNLFSSTTNGNVQRELVIFLTPYVLNNSGDVEEMMDVQKPHHPIIEEWPAPGK